VRVLKYLLIICIIVIINHPISVSAAEVSDELSTAEYESNEIGENVNLGIHTNFCMIIENDKPSDQSNDTTDTNEGASTTGQVTSTVTESQDTDNTEQLTATLRGDRHSNDAVGHQPNTGDSSSLEVYVISMIISGILILVTLKRLVSNRNK
jgi:hypothetical protein